LPLLLKKDVRKLGLALDAINLLINSKEGEGSKQFINKKEKPQFYKRLVIKALANLGSLLG
jgi:hypothetical protein